MGLFITWENVTFFLISSMVLGLPDQVKILLLWYLIELLWFLTGQGLLELWHLIYPRLLTGFGMLAYLINLGLQELPVRYLALFLLFSTVNGFESFWMESLHSRFLLVLELIKGPFLALWLLHFSCCILMTFLMTLSLVLVSMLMILLSILGVIRNLICGGSLSWLLNLNLIYRALWTGLGSD